MAKSSLPFYKSAAWLKCRIMRLLQDNRLCQRCLRKNKLTPADMVHHKEHFEDRPDLALDLDNLESLCNACHNQMHPEKGGGRQKKPQEKPRRAKVVSSKANKEVT